MELKDLLKPAKRSRKPKETFYRTVTDSPQWKAWMQENERRLKVYAADEAGQYDDTGKYVGPSVWDMDEVMECGWISAGHFQEFLAWNAKHV